MCNQHMATESAQVQLERVQAAIAAIESGTQSHSILGRTFTRADLATLYEREKELLVRVDREARGGIRIQRGVPI
jgi:hypothetical protein